MANPCLTHMHSISLSAVVAPKSLAKVERVATDQVAHRAFIQKVGPFSVARLAIGPAFHPGAQRCRQDPPDATKEMTTPLSNPPASHLFECRRRAQEPGARRAPSMQATAAPSSERRPLNSPHSPNLPQLTPTHPNGAAGPGAARAGPQPRLRAHPPR